MCLHLFFLVQGKTSIAVLIVDYRHSIVMVIATVLTACLWVFRGDGESNPFTCWQLKYDTGLNIVGLYTLLLFFFIYRLSTKISEFMHL